VFYLVRDIAHPGGSGWRGRGRCIQLQERPVCVGVAELLLALLLQVLLQRAGRFGVVPLQAVDDVPDELGPFLGVFAVHLGRSVVVVVVPGGGCLCRIRGVSNNNGGEVVVVNFGLEISKL